MPKNNDKPFLPVFFFSFAVLQKYSHSSVEQTQTKAIHCRLEACGLDFFPGKETLLMNANVLPPRVDRGQVTGSILIVLACLTVFVDWMLAVSHRARLTQPMIEFEN